MEAPKIHPFVQVELMMPILPIVRVANVDEAIEFAVEVEHGNRHTAMMHSRNVDKLTKMAKEIETTFSLRTAHLMLVSALAEWDTPHLRLQQVLPVRV